MDQCKPIVHSCMPASAVSAPITTKPQHKIKHPTTCTRNGSWRNHYMEVKKFAGLSQRKSSESGEDMCQFWICMKLQLSISWQIQVTQIIAVCIIHESFKSRQRHHHTCLRLLTAFTLAPCFNRSIRICFPWHSQKESSSASCPSIFQDGEAR